MRYAIYPGTVVTHEGETQDLTYEELIELYGVDAEDCVLGTTVPQNQLMYYILLKPRQDGEYHNINDQVQLGNEIKWGPDFDGKKKWIQETDYNTMYSAREAESKP